MFLNHTFICCYINSVFDYFLGTQKALMSWNDPHTVRKCVKLIKNVSLPAK